MLAQFPLFEILSLVVIGAFFSAAETSFFSLSRFQLRQIKTRNKELFTDIRNLLDKPAALVVTVLIGNELTNVTASYVMANYYQRLNFDPLWITLCNLLTVVPIFLLFSDITPKVIGSKANMALVPYLTKPFIVLYKLLFPFRFFIEMIVNLLTRRFLTKPTAEAQLHEEDFRELLEEGKKKGAIHSREQDLIENLFETDDDKILEVSTPIHDSFTVNEIDTCRSVIEKISGEFYARIPVLDANGEIVGILYAKDLLNHLNRPEAKVLVREVMKEPIFVSYNMNVEALFKRLRQLKRHIAIVQDKRGRSVGIITMEDILEQIFGELWEGNK
jgi:putative hemolysin